jgi:hypothetical protein
MGRFLDSVALRIVIVDPVFLFSLKNSHCGLFLPFASRAAYCTQLARSCRQSRAATSFETICRDKSVEIGYAKPHSSADFYERDPPPPNPTVKCGGRNREYLRGLADVDESFLVLRFHG